MPNNYTAQPGTAKSPSPAPGPRVQPTISTPADTTDDVNAASVAQALEAPTDFIGHIQSAVGIDIPVLASGSSGFTAPSYNGFGGTVTPSGSVKINTGTRFVIKIISGGAVGVATFQTSIDGGNTFGATQTTAASMTDATSGITLAFSGTLTTNGTATFRSAFTPLAEWQDSAGNGRWLIDHNGYPTGGRISQFREEWIFSPGLGGSAWVNNGGAGGSALCANPTANYGARALQLTPSSGGAGSVYNSSGPKLFMSNSSWLAAVIEFELGFNASAAGTASNVDFFAGMGSQGDTSTDTNIIAIYKPANQANYKLATSSGGGVMQLWTTGIAPSSNPNNVPIDRIKIEVYGSASPIGAYTVRLFINEQIAAVAAAGNASAALLPVFSSANTTGAPSGGPVGYIGPMLITWNRLLSGPRL